MYNSYQRGNWWQQIPPVTKNLIIINLIVWLAEILVPGFSHTLINRLGLHLIGGHDFNPAQIFTYMFLHDPHNFAHILFNMFTLWMFGRILEQAWGSQRFLFFYIVCGVGAALVQEAVWGLTWRHEYVSIIARANGLTYEHAAGIVDSALKVGDAGFTDAISAFKDSFCTIGASGAVYGILLGFAFTFPNLPLYFFFIPVPIKAKYMVIGYGVIEFLLGVTGTAGTIAHFAHLGGMLFGIILLLYWKKKGIIRRLG